MSSLIFILIIAALVYFTWDMDFTPKPYEPPKPKQPETIYIIKKVIKNDND